ncbi:MAG: hypothetical protein LBR40_02345 [Bacilli bacterium]|nr:hypothetical protein [Bacilli bacterium]
MNYRIAYEIINDEVIIIKVGKRENFYVDLKRYLKRS